MKVVWNDRKAKEVYIASFIVKNLKMVGQSFQVRGQAI